MTAAREFASAELKADRDIVMEAVKRNGQAPELASAELKADRGIVMEAVKQDGRALMYAAAELKADREIVMEAVKRYGAALRYAVAKLKTDRDIVMEAVKQDGYALDYAADQLKADRDIAMDAIKHNGDARGMPHPPSVTVASRTTSVTCCRTPSIPPCTLSCPPSETSTSAICRCFDQAHGFPARSARRPSGSSSNSPACATGCCGVGLSGLESTVDWT